MQPLSRWWLRRRHGAGEWGGLFAAAPGGEWVSLDLETTGIDPARDHILSLAAVPVRDGTAWLSERFERRVHMAARGAPIANDRTYPALRHRAPGDYSAPLQLLAKRLRFIDPLSGVERRFCSSFLLHARSPGQAGAKDPVRAMPAPRPCTGSQVESPQDPF